MPNEEEKKKLKDKSLELGELEKLKIQSEIDRNKAEADYFRQQAETQWYSGKSLTFTATAAILALSIGSAIYGLVVRPIVTKKDQLATVNTFLAKARTDSLNFEKKRVSRGIEGIEALIEIVIQGIWGINEDDKLGYANAREKYQMIKAKNYYDYRANPAGTGVVNKFSLGDRVVYDDATRLMWQQSGSDSRRSFEEAQIYIAELNKEKYGGYNGWRLPTLEEAMSLMEPEGNKDGLYINPKFDGKQYWIWTSDEWISDDPDAYPSSPAWFLFLDEGFCDNYHGDVQGYCFVRAVRGGQP